MNLHETTVTFDDVSGLTYSVTKFGPVTAFNFVANGRHEYAVQIGGKVCVEPKMTVTALLRETGNWQTLEGWINHQTGRIEGAPSTSSLRFSALLFGSLFLIVLVSGAYFWSWGRSEHALAIAMDLTFGFGALYTLVGWYRGSKIWDRLEAVKSGNLVTARSR